MAIKNINRIGFVRHGQTYANIDRVWHGKTDTQLTELGHYQARRLGEHFHQYMKPDVIYSSPLQRARITAENIASRFDLNVNLDARLMEFDLGDWEGREFDSLKESGDIVERLIRESDFTAPNGESQNMVKKRVVEAIEEISSRHSRQNVIIVAHGVSIGIALSHYIDNDTTQWFKYHKDNTSFSELCLKTNSLISFNKTAHLD